MPNWQKVVLAVIAGLALAVFSKMLDAQLDESDLRIQRSFQSMAVQAP